MFGGSCASGIQRKRMALERGAGPSARGEGMRAGKAGLPSGPGRSGRVTRSVGARRAGGGRPRRGPCGAGPSRRRWAERGRETVGPGWARGKRKREGRWAGERLGRAEGLGWGFGVGFLFYFFFSSISNSNQLFEFKQNFEFHNLMHTSKINAPA